MILPTKYMDLKNSLLTIAIEILEELRRTKVISLEELDELIQVRVDHLARINFVPALNFLYLAGCLDYDEATDAVIYLERNMGGEKL